MASMNVQTSGQTNTDVSAAPTEFRRPSPLVLIKRHWQFYVLVALPVAYIVIFKYIPMVGAQIAFRDYSPILGFWRSPWIGGREFVRFFQSPSFWTIIRNTISISALRLGIGFAAPIILALLLNEVGQRGFKRTVQMITYAPHFISTVVMASIITMLLSPRNGIAAIFVRAFDWTPVNILTIGPAYKWIHVLSDIWQRAGYGAIIYIAALAGINPDLYEAAKIDGVSRTQKIRHIDIPGILPTIVILLILNVGEVMNVGFEKIYLLQNPSNLTHSEVIATYVYKIGLRHYNFSFGAAVGLFNSVINFVLLVTVNWVARRISEHSLW